ncbi:MAG: hypothetical protein ACT4QF_01515 [Sporichthyaceae bacterium]
MSGRIRIRAAATTLTAATMLVGGVALAGSAAASGPYEQTLLTPVLDAIYPMPDGLDNGYYTEQERIYGIVGMGPTGGPYGEFPQPPNRDDATYKGFPGWGAQGMVGDLTGVTPRPPGGDDANGRPARATVGPLILPFCDSPEPCDLAPLVDDREPEPDGVEEVLAQRAAGTERAVAEADWMTGLELRKALAGITPPAATATLPATAQADLEEILYEGPVNDALMPVGDVLELVDPTGAEERQGEDDALSAPAGQDDAAELSTEKPKQANGKPGKR